IIDTPDLHWDLCYTTRLEANVLPYSLRIGHVSHPILRLHDLAECCVFGKQSVDPFHCDPLHFGDWLLFPITRDCQFERFVRLRRTKPSGGIAKMQRAPLLPKLRG